MSEWGITRYEVERLLESDRAAMRAELHTELGALRHELGALRDELRATIARRAADVEDDVGRLRGDVAAALINGGTLP